MFDSIEFWKTVLASLGSVGTVLLVGNVGFVKGWWRTNGEMTRLEEINAIWKERALRSESQTDTLLPALNRLNDSIFASLHERRLGD